MLSVITHFKNTGAERAANLAFMHAWLHARFPAAEIICTEQDTATSMPEYVTRLSVMINAGHNKSLCVNTGVEAASNGNLLILDPDTFFDPSLITMPAENTMLVPLNKQLRLTREATAEVLAGDAATFDVATYVAAHNGTHIGYVIGANATTGGVQFLTKTLFNAAGKMDVGIKTHPWDIGGFSGRLQKAGGRIVMSPQPGLHFYH